MATKKGSKKAAAKKGAGGKRAAKASKKGATGAADQAKELLAVLGRVHEIETELAEEMLAQPAGAYSFRKTYDTLVRSYQELLQPFGALDSRRYAYTLAKLSHMRLDMIHTFRKKGAGGP